MIDRKAHWQSIYREKSPLEVSWYQGEPRLSLELVRHCGLRHDEAIIDVGGGASVLVDFLFREGYTDLSVLDISAVALDSARDRMGEAAKHVKWIEADITDFEPLRRYALWHDRAVFHFLTEASDRDKYIACLKAGLRPGGHLVLASFAIGGPERCSGLPIVQYDASKLKAELGDEFVLVEERAEVHVTPAEKSQKFVYFRFVRTDRRV
ncbi:MAG: class I SAM-dependent methyltransferase [Candidatus Thiodiazotropha sp.]